MSNDITKSIISQLGADILLREDGRTYETTIGDDKFRFTRKKARERSSMLLKAAPATKLAGEVFKALRSQIKSDTPVDDLTMEAKMAMGASVLSAIGDALADIDSDRFDSLIGSLVSWCDWFNPATDQYQAMTGTAYEVVLDKNLYIQIPLLVGVIQANFLVSSSSDLNV